MLLYYKQMLSKTEQRAYDALVSAVTNLDASVFLPGITGDKQINDILFAIERDVSELFYLGDEYSYIKGRNGIRLNIEYRYSRRVILDYLKQINAILDEALSFSKNMSDRQAVELFHDFLIRHTVYTSPVNDDDGEVYGIEGALIHKRCVCAGLSHSFKLLCDKRSIDCIYISGFGVEDGKNQGNHGWNMVKLDGKWYFVDVTADQSWSSPNFISKHDFLISTPELMQFHRIREQTFFFPYCFESLNPLIRIKNEREAAIALVNACRLGKKAVEFRFETPVEPNSFQENIVEEIYKLPGSAGIIGGYSVGFRSEGSEQTYTLQVRLKKDN